MLLPARSRQKNGEKNLTRAGAYPARAKRSFSSVCKVIPDQDLQKLVAVHLADQGAGLVMVGDIGGVLGEDVAHDLVDRVIALLLQRLVHGQHDPVDLRVLIDDEIKLPGVVVHACTTFLFYLAPA